MFKWHWFFAESRPHTTLRRSSGLFGLSQDVGLIMLFHLEVIVRGGEIGGGGGLGRGGGGEGGRGGGRGKFISRELLVRLT